MVSPIRIIPGRADHWPPPLAHHHYSLGPPLSLGPTHIPNQIVYTIPTMPSHSPISYLYQIPSGTTPTYPTPHSTQTPLYTNRTS